VKLFIKNMVCDRCKAAVKGELDRAQMKYTAVELGEVDLVEPVAPRSLEHFKKSIEPLGFELIEGKASREVSQIKNMIIGWVRGNEKASRKIKFSAYLSEQMHKDYASLSNLFSGVEGTTIEKYLIQQKIELVKELLVYDEYSLAEIADRLHYSSAQHLSSQFKKTTGLTPSHFRKIGAGRRRSLDEV